MEHRITNFSELASSPAREQALRIAEAGLEAIDTASVIAQSVTIDETTQVLHVRDLSFDLNRFKAIRVIGFGKASCDAAVALEKALKGHIHSGVVIDIKTTTCEIIEPLVGTHPRPSPQNVDATKRIIELSKGLTQDDLVIVAVSGGGSALVCWPETECEQGLRLYEEFLGAGGSIGELNTVRKHLSFLKGGGLAKILHPATVVGLIFSDVPGDKIENVASGPTCKDTSTIAEASAIIEKYGLTGYDLVETPKEDVYFENVHNILLVSNGDALAAMQAEAERLGLSARILTREMYEDAQHAVPILKAGAAGSAVAIAGGETAMSVKGSTGSGGRCSYLALAALPEIGEGDVVLAIASDGIDNSDCAGAIVDSAVVEKARERGLDITDHIARFDSYDFFKELGDGLMFTGQTGSNVSDLYLWLHR